MQEVLDFAIRFAQRMMECCESHHGIQQRVRLDSNLKKGGVKEAARIVLEKVMVMGEIILMVVKKELEISRQMRVVYFARTAFLRSAG